MPGGERRWDDSSVYIVMCLLTVCVPVKPAGAGAVFPQLLPTPGCSGAQKHQARCRKAENAVLLRAATRGQQTAALPSPGEAPDVLEAGLVGF